MNKQVYRDPMSHKIMLTKIKWNMTIKVYFYIFIVALSFPVHAAEVTKNDWLNAMATALPTAFCNPAQYFRQCFTVTAQVCEEVASSVTRVCLNKNEQDIPDKLIQPRDGIHWGTIIGVCAGRAYEASLIKKRIKNEKCDDRNRWQ